VLPSVVARELDDDPEHLAIICLQLTHYARAKVAFDNDGDEASKAWRNDPMMLLVRRHTKEWLARRAEERKKVWG
jgi:hypothetical protein